VSENPQIIKKGKKRGKMSTLFVKWNAVEVDDQIDHAQWTQQVKTLLETCWISQKFFD
jgi:hypothetical protein